MKQPAPAAADGSAAVTLSDIRANLIRQEDTIIFNILERAQFAQNKPVYQPGAVPVPGACLSTVYMGVMKDIFLLAKCDAARIEMQTCKVTLQRPAPIFRGSYLVACLFPPLQRFRTAVAPCPCWSTCCVRRSRCMGGSGATPAQTSTHSTRQVRPIMFNRYLYCCAVSVVGCRAVQVSMRSAAAGDVLSECCRFVSNSLPNRCRRMRS